MLLDYLTVSLHSTSGMHLPAVRDVQGDCQCPLKNDGNYIPTGAQKALRFRHFRTIFSPASHNGWCQPIGGNVSHPTDSPTDTSLRLCNSLVLCTTDNSMKWFITVINCCRVTSKDNTDTLGPIRSDNWSVGFSIVQRYFLMIFLCFTGEYIAI